MGYIGNEPAEAYSSISKQTITGNGGTSYTLDFAVGTAAEVSVFVNNVRQEPGVAYTVAGTALTMTGAVSSTDDFYVIFQGKAQQTVDVEISKDDSPQLGGNLDVNGNAITGSTVAINGSTGEFMITATENGPVALRYDNNLKLTTKSDGVDITGELQADSLDIDGDASITGHSSIGVDAVASTRALTVAGATDGSGSSILVCYNSSLSPQFSVRDDGLVTASGSLTVSDNVGIGCSPVAKLHIRTQTNGNAAFQNSTSVTGGVKINAFNDAASASVPFEIDGSSLQFNIASVEKMRIDSSGNVSLGNGKFLQFKDSGGTARDVITIDAYNGLNINSAGGGSAAPIVFKSNNAETMRIDSSGNVLVGSTYAAFNARQMTRFEATGTSTIGHVVWGGGSSGQKFVQFVNSGGGEVGSITQSGGAAAAYNTSSDYRLKTAVTYDWDATSRLKQLKPARFKWIVDGDDAVPVDGFLAHEVQDVVPESITGTKDGMRDEEYEVSAATGDIYTPAIEAVLDEDGNEVTPAVAEVIHSTDVERPEELAEGQQWRETTAAVIGTRSVPDYQGIDQSKLVPLLVKTIQELEARITALEAS